MPFIPDDEEKKSSFIADDEQPEQPHYDKELPDWAINHPNLAGVYGAGKAVLDPLLEAGGLVGGAMAGAGVMSPVGAGLGYAGAKEISKDIDMLAGFKKPKPVTQELTEAGKNVAIGASMEAGGQIATPIIGATLRAGGKIASNILGTLTGSGKKAIEVAAKQNLKPSPYWDALKQRASTEDILSDIQGAVGQLKINRAMEYKADLEKLQATGNLVGDKQTVQGKIVSLLRNFKVSGNLNNKGDVVLDFSKSPVDKSARTQLNELVDDVIKWDDYTPSGLDTLKQRIDDFYTPSKNTRAIVAGLRNTVKNEIVRLVPTYEKMTGRYEQATKAIQEIDRALSSGKKANIDTALRKLDTIFRDVNKYRLSQVEKLSNITGTDIEQKLAGANLSELMPRGVLPKFVPVTGLGLAGLLHNPALAMALPLTSPKLAGYLAPAAGSLYRTGMPYTGIATKSIALNSQRPPLDSFMKEE